MRALLALLVVAAWTVPAQAAPLKLPHLIKSEEKVCERKADGVYCGRGLKRKTLFRCAGGVVAITYACDWGCDPKAQACLKKPPRRGAVPNVAGEPPVAPEKPQIRSINTR